MLHEVTVLLEYLTDCSIRVSQSSVVFCVGEFAPLWICHCNPYMVMGIRLQLKLCIVVWSDICIIY